MEQRTSVKNNCIKYNPATKDKGVYDLLLERFGVEHLEEKSLADLHDPFLLKDMDKAVERVQGALKNQEKIIIFGDYDVDGVTSTSILVHFLTKLGAKVSYRLPHRVNDGYGLKQHFVDEAATLGVSLIITVDCGTKDLEIISHAKKVGVDIIVTDHHAVPDTISTDAIAVINPKRSDCTYPFKYLAGAGVAFKLMQALAYKLLPKSEYMPYLQESIDICAIGTVADCMSIIGENRIIVREGLKQLKNSRSIGVRRLIEDALETDLDADVFGFTIGPRLNAAGRMDTPYKAVNLILNNSSTINQTLIDIEKLNNLRKAQTKIYVEDALNTIHQNDNLLIYDSVDIEHGIIGIVAGRLTEQFYKPSIVLKDEGEILVGSCRSPDYFSIIELLEKYSEYFIAFGGHKQAAGFSISKAKFTDFKRKILGEMNKKDLSQYKKELIVDKVVKMDELGFQFLEQVNIFKPFGIGNTKPLFMIDHFAYEKIEFLGQGRDHIKFTTKFGFKIFGFFMGDYYEEIRRSKSPISIVFDISEDNWMGKKNLLLKIIDIVIH